MVGPAGTLITLKLASSHVAAAVVVDVYTSAKCTGVVPATTTLPDSTHA
ncbi:hypothetical protein SDC9_128519 [bioreactor metagenome]|uniref:Uncharacterized protein n=1 Tax=bioreactor metagenome TaxID=1076179 RepID=A0A645CWF8_9ZZZZ